MTKQGQKQNGEKEQSGCLIKLFFIVAAAMIITAIIIPRFDCMKFSARPKYAEANEYLLEIYKAQKKYNKKHGTYASGEDCFKKLGWQPEGITRYTYCCDKDSVSTANIPAPAPPVITITKDTFIITAVGNIDNDMFYDQWTINEKKDLINVASDLDN
jgi:Tfp pilus assembly protein PilE